MIRVLFAKSISRGRDGSIRGESPAFYEAPGAAFYRRVSSRATCEIVSSASLCKSGLYVQQIPECNVVLHVQACGAESL